MSSAEDASAGRKRVRETDGTTTAEAPNNRAAQQVPRKVTKQFQLGITTAMKDSDPTKCGKVLISALDANVTLPASLVAGVLHHYYSHKHYAEGVELYNNHIKTRVVDSDHERISTVLVRLLCHAKRHEVGDLRQKVAEFAHRLHAKNQLKRRLFTEPLKQLAAEGAAAAAVSLFEVAAEYSIELWDEDLLAVAVCIRAVEDTTEKVALANKLLESALVRYHPIVGRRLATTLGATIASIDDLSNVPTAAVGDDGVCPNCDTKLQAFDFAPEDRSSLLKDITERLVGPSLRRFKLTGSHRVPKGSKNAPVEPSLDEKPLTPEELAPFTAFSDHMKAVCGAPLPPDYDAYCILDGANIGYYRVSAWYTAAKQESLRQKGVDPATVPAYELDHSHRKGLGRGMDVPLNFDAIDNAIKKAIQRRWFPVVVLHERHLQPGTVTARNQEYLDRWAAAGTERGRLMVVSSPSAVNDDFAWLHASVAHRTFVISNDLMRDHHYNTLGRRSFLRWRERYRVSFSCFWSSPKDSLNNAHFSLHRPPTYSTWTQGGGHNWHIPFHEHLDVVDQGTNVVKSAEEVQKEEAEAESIRWVCTFPPRK